MEFNMNIPIYRAKKIDSDEYVEGFYFNYDDSLGYKPMIISKESGIEFEISELTLAIHFPDMIDSEGNKIFASLNEDGKGGDISTLDNEMFVCIIDDACAVMSSENESYDFSCMSPNSFKVTGIQQ